MLMPLWHRTLPQTMTISLSPVSATVNSIDIRTPMNAIIGFTDIALKNEPAPEVKSYLEKVKRSSDYLLSLINIISNAVKFTHDGGRITFETFRKPGTAPDNIIFGYRISDTGIGMSKEFASHIFDEFSQENSGARTQYQGTGLGMAITKRYVELMGGTITVESTKGKGTTFTVELPLTLADPIEKREAYTAPVQKRTTDLHVLMAEDNDLNAEIATMLLEDEGMHVTRAADGCEVVKMFKSHPASTYDVILMDIMMPRMNGYEATRTIRSLSDRPDGGTIPIIAMTANAFAEDVVKCKEAGMDSHLPKPFKADQLIASIIAPKN